MDDREKGLNCKNNTKHTRSPWSKAAFQGDQLRQDYFLIKAVEC